MLAAHADNAFTRLMGTAKLLCVPAADRLAQRCDARRRGVFGAVTLQRFDSRLFDVSGRREVRLARPKIHYVQAPSTQFLCLRKNHHGWRDGDTIDTIRKSLCHFGYPETPF